MDDGIGKPAAASTMRSIPYMRVFVGRRFDSEVSGDASSSSSSSNSALTNMTNIPAVISRLSDRKPHARLVMNDRVARSIRNLLANRPRSFGELQRMVRHPIAKCVKAMLQGGQIQYVVGLSAADSENTDGCLCNPKLAIVKPNNDSRQGLGIPFALEFLAPESLKCLQDSLHVEQKVTNELLACVARRVADFEVEKLVLAFMKSETAQPVEKICARLKYCSCRRKLPFQAIEIRSAIVRLVVGC